MGSSSIEANLVRVRGSARPSRRGVVVVMHRVAFSSLKVALVAKKEVSFLLIVLLVVFQHLFQRQQSLLH